MNALPSVSVIIVSYSVRDLLRRCLESVRTQQGVTVETWVVDNASPDGSADMVASEFPEARLIRNAENVGFARANNQALRQAMGEILLLLNPDTELSPRALAVLPEVFARHPRAGAVGLALRNLDGSPQPSCHAFPGVWNQALESLGLRGPSLALGIGTPMAAPVPRGGEGEVDWVSGACMAISRAARNRVGGLEESLFLYGEEMDWSWRARAVGFTTVYSNAATVMHHVGASGVGLRGPLFVHNLQARLWFLRRHRGAWRAALARELIVLGSWLRLIHWRARARAEGAQPAPHTRDQLERFQAVLDWRRGGRS